jgi:TDG/mug DNA glycosylase family protein
MHSDFSHGFAPVARADARILVLGSLPSRRSLEAGEYYAHPRNAFWPIMAELCGATGAYRERCLRLMASGIALWDVLAASERPGSLDADIRQETAMANDFEGFFRGHPRIERIGFNGKTAERLYARFVAPGVGTAAPRLVPLPSTSPANARLSFPDKLEAWRRFLSDGHP